LKDDDDGPHGDLEESFSFAQVFGSAAALLEIEITLNKLT
jgi:hypothetical protein